MCDPQSFNGLLIIMQHYISASYIVPGIAFLARSSYRRYRCSECVGSGRRGVHVGRVCGQHQFSPSDVAKSQRPRGAALEPTALQQLQWSFSKIALTEVPYAIVSDVIKHHNFGSLIYFWNQGSKMDIACTINILVYVNYYILECLLCKLETNVFIMQKGG